MNPKKRKKRVLFICTHNSARSQMAEGFLKVFFGDYYEAYSAGTEPAKVNSFVVRVMAEIGIDISQQRAKNISEFQGKKFDLVVTVCDRAGQTCPFFPGGGEVLHRGFSDPAAYKGGENEKLIFFRKVRDEIKKWINERFDPDL